MIRFIAEIEVSTKAGVLNPEERAVFAAVRNTGCDVSSLRLTRKFYINFSCNSESESMDLMKNLCEDLLANTVIQDYRIDVREAR